MPNPPVDPVPIKDYLTPLEPTILSMARMTRRAALKAMAGSGAMVILPRLGLCQTVADCPWQITVKQFLQGLSRADGGYGWVNKEAPHLTPTFAVIGCYRVLREIPPSREKLVEFVRTHHPSGLKKLEQPHRAFDYQQIQSLLWLGEDAASFRDIVRSWTSPIAYLKQYEQHGYPVFSQEVAAFKCWALLGLPLEDLARDHIVYLDSRRRQNGSFNNTPTADGGDGHVMNTWWGLLALQTLGRIAEKKEQTIEWLQACQLANGAYTWQPKPEFAGNDAAAYTWAAVMALQLLGSFPAKREACVAYLLSLANADGGFGDRPGWQSNPMATRFALEALQALDALAPAEELMNRTSLKPRRRVTLPPELKVFSIQIEAHGKGSPAEAVELARSLRIHLWGAKNAKPEWLARAQSIAAVEKVAVEFFVSNEEYGTWVNVPGLGTYSHVSDLVAPAGKDAGSSLAHQGTVSWPEFRQRRLTQLHQIDGRLIWQFGENEELARLFLDDSLDRRGYAAISTFHFGNPDFTNSEPFLESYRGQIPFIALQDAHGDEPWWFADMTTGFRTVFLGAEPTWEAWLKALEHNWVVAIRRDAQSGFQTWMHAGSREVLDFVSQHKSDWQWWDNPSVQRPLVSIVVVKPEDEFEAGRPNQGVTIRVRCAWENTTQGRPRKPLAELLSLTLDGSQVTPRLVAPPSSGGGAHTDFYHAFHLANPATGSHTVEATVRLLATDSIASRTISFRT